MSKKNSINSDMKVSLRASGLLEEFITLLPDGKKNAILSQILVDSIVYDRFYQSLVIVVGVKEATKIHKKVKKMINGGFIEPDMTSNIVKSDSAFIEEKNEKKEDQNNQENVDDLDDESLIGDIDFDFEK